MIVANATQLAVVTATADPEPRTGLIDRAMVAALDAGIEPMLVVTKTDLEPADALLALYGPLDLPVFRIRDREVPEELRQALAGQQTVLVGHSGVGKSTLVNALIPSADRVTGHVNAVTGRGRHTSTSVVALHLPGGGMIIDTPGIRSFGLAHVDVSRVIHAFPDLEALTENCPRACSHDEPDCALNDVGDAHGDAAALGLRIDSLRRLVRSRATTVEDDEPRG